MIVSELMLLSIETGMLEYLNSELDKENEYIKKHIEKRNRKGIEKE
jgi:hypothetical protein